MSRDTRFDWMNEVCFEPGSQKFEPPQRCACGQQHGSNRSSRKSIIFYSLAIVAVAIGSLLALSIN